MDVVVIPWVSQRGVLSPNGSTVIRKGAPVE